MGRISDAFCRLKEKNEKALVGFVTAGDPSLEKSGEILEALCYGGVDILELGIPFSDPTADGPVIQRSSVRALGAGMKMAKVFDLVRQVRKISDIPVVLFGYYNPIFVYGGKRFHDDAVAAGADGLLVVDLPPEESDELTGTWPEGGLDFIRLLAPTTPPDRMKMIGEKASGFVYLVSMTGVTGSSGFDAGGVKNIMEDVKQATDVPVCVGFGISTPEQANQVACIADGVVVGSGFERVIEENLDAPDLTAMVRGYAAALKAATRM